MYINIRCLYIYFLYINNPPSLFYSRSLRKSQQIHYTLVFQLQFNRQAWPWDRNLSVQLNIQGFTGTICLEAAQKHLQVVQRGGKPFGSEVQGTCSLLQVLLM